MEMLARIDCMRYLWRYVCLLAFSLAMCCVVQGDDELCDDDCPAQECVNCNLYWHGDDGFCLSRLPRWYAAADLFVPRRDIDSNDDRRFAFGNAGVQRLGSSDFKDEYDAGLRVMLGYAVNDWYRIEGSFYGSYFFSDSMALRTPGANDLRFPFGDTGSFASIRYSSTLDNAELNLRGRLGMPPGPIQASLLFGGRFMKLDEKFFYASNGAAVPRAAVATSNDLLGLQVGMLAQWQSHPRSWLDYEIKAGILTNRASQRTTSNAFAGTMAAEKDVTAFLVEMSLIFNYQITPSLTLRFGYNAIWIDGVALGVPNVQRDVNLLTLGPAKLDHSGSVVYHGPSFGIVWVR